MKQVICTFIFSACLLAAAKSTSFETNLDHQFSKADSLLGNRFFIEALKVFTDLSSAYSTEHANRQYLITQNKIAECYFHLGQLNKSILVSKAILETNKELLTTIEINALINLGRVFVKKSDFETAAAYLGQSIELIKKSESLTPMLVKAYYELGILYTSYGKNDLALDYLNQALNIQLSVQEVSDQTAAIYHRMAIISFHVGAPELLNDYFSKAVRIRMQLHGQIHPTNMISYNSIGVVIKISQTIQNIIDSFEGFYDNALKVQTSFFGESHPDIANTYLNWGVTRYYQKRYDEAINFFQKSLHFQTDMYDFGHPDIQLNYINIGMTYSEMKENDSSDYYFNKTLSIQKDQGIGQSYYSTIPYYYLGKNKLEQGQFPAALQMLQKALVTNHETFRNLDINQNPGPEGYINEITFLKTLHLKAIAFAERSKAENDLELLESAFDTFIVCEDVINLLMSEYRKETDRLFFGENFRAILEDAIEVAIRLYEKTGESKYLEKSFFYSEKSHGNTLRLFLMESNIQKITGSGDSLGQQVDWIKSQISINESRLRNMKTLQGPSEQIDAQKDILFELKEKLRNHLIELESRYPEYFKVKYAGDITSANEIQRRLDKETSLVEYFEANESYIVFVITKDNFDFIRLDSTSQLEDKLNAFFKQHTDRIPTNFSKIGYELYQDLFQPVESYVKTKKVIIIPDGKLWQLNFELMLGGPDSSSFQNLPYLLKEYAFSYANSATVLFEETARNTINNTRCLAYSFTSENPEEGGSGSLRTLRSESLVDLPGTRKELQALSTHFEGDYYYGSQANEASFKQSAHEYGILHLALHGITDNRNPKDSRLVFSQNKKDFMFSEDNFLHVDEIYALNLDVELAVLSACNSGKGKLAAGEGALSIGRAFQYAGARSLIVSQWEAYDQISPKIMEAFYKNLKEGMSKSVALQQAKLAILRESSESISAPLFWGNFILIGDDRPISKEREYYLSLILTVVIILVILFIKRRSPGDLQAG